MKQDLAGLSVPSTVLQYVDDILICFPTSDDCHAETIAILTKLAEGGQKASLTRLHYCRPQVKHLGRTISHGSRANAPSQMEGISKAPKPQTVGQIMSFLGMTGFSLVWVEDYAVKVALLYELITQADSKNLKDTLKWTAEAMIAFESIKQIFQIRPSNSYYM